MKKCLYKIIFKVYLFIRWLVSYFIREVYSYRFFVVFYSIYLDEYIYENEVFEIWFD